MKKMMIVALFLFGVCVNTSAQSKQEDIKELFLLMKSEKTINSTMANMLEVLKQSASKRITGEDAQAKYDKYIEFVMREIKEISMKLVSNDMVLLYDKYFTHSEIKDLIAFYKSPIGEKLLAVSPELTKELMDVMMDKYMVDFQQKVTDKMNELK